MEIKTSQPIKVLFKSVKATLKCLKECVGDTPDRFYEVAGKSGLTPAGPQYWRYLNADGNPETEFTLEMGLPVNGDSTPTEFGLNEYPTFKYVSSLHNGTWDTIGETYNKLISELKMKGLNMSNECREVYLVVDEANPQNHQTEVQVGIQ
jgi:effector-binding domain-containing protein